MRTELYIGNTLVELEEDIVASLNFNIADIRQPDKRNSSYSKTITLPGTKNNNILFGHMFEISRETITQDFNPNKKAPAKLYIDSILQMSGFARLMQVNTEGTKVTYEISIYETLADLFTDFGDDSLSDIDLTDLSHAFTFENIFASWHAPKGEGYLYPIIDYGEFDLKKVEIKKLYPAIYVRELFTRVFQKYGYKINSDFVDSDYFKGLFINLKKAPELSAVEQAKRRAKVRINTDIPVEGTSGPGPVFQYIPPTTLTISKFEATDIDNTGIVEQSTTPNRTYLRPYKAGFYNVIVRAMGSVQAAGNDGSLVNPLYPIKVEVFSSLQDSPPIKIYSESRNITIYQDGTEVGYDETFEFKNIYLKKGGGSANLYAVITLRNTVPYPNGGVNNNVSIQKLVVGAGSFVDLVSQQGAVNVGDTLDLGPYMWNDKKIKDFMKSIILMHNLYLDPDKDDDKLLNIEPITDFYTNDTVDWSNKIDRGKKVELIPLGEITAKTYTFKYKYDPDYQHEFYKSKWNEEFGSKVVEVDNDFVSNDSKIELIFSSTLNTDPQNQNRSLPSINKNNDLGEVVPYDNPNIRIFQYGGIRYCELYNIVDSALDINYALLDNYPFACHVDSDGTPTMDILFETPYEIYWGINTGITNNYTTNNLFNKYYRVFVQDFTDKDSKLLRAYFRLTPLDIFNFKFSNIVQIDGVNFRVNKIMDYNPVTSSVCKVELTKTKVSSPFVAGIIDVGTPTPTGPYTIIEGGLDEVRNVSATNDTYILDGGLDEVRNIAATGNIYIVDGQ